MIRLFNKRGFTILEVLITTFLVGIIVTAMTYVNKACFKVYTTGQDRRISRTPLSLAIELLRTELAQATTITTCNSTTLTFTKAGSATTITYAQSGSNLIREGVVKATGVQAGTLFACTAGLVTIDITATTYGASVRLRTKVRPANMAVGLVGWWKLDETSGTSAADSSGYGTSGTITNGPTLGSAAASANLGTAITFSAASSRYIAIGTPAQVGLTTYTVMCWFNRTNTVSTNANTGNLGIATIEPLVTKLVGEADGDTRDGNYFLGLSVVAPASNVAPRVGADFEDMATGLNHPVTGLGGTAITSDGTVWYHAAVTFDGATEIVYLNGVSDNSVATAAVPRSDSIQGLAIGTTTNSTGGHSGYFNGAIDDVRIYNRALTAQEILEVYNDGKANYT